MNEVASLISQLGFPIVCVIGCAAFIKFQYESNLKQIDAMRSEHKEEMKAVTEAVNNNTIALQKLIDRLGGE